MKNTLLFILVAITTSATPNFLVSQQDTLKYDLDTINVEAVHSIVDINSSPFAMSYISRSDTEINGESAVTLKQITRHIPGIWVNDRENYALGEKITMRGIGWRSAFGVRGVQVILDGIPLTVADGQSGMNIIDPSIIRKMEVLRGPASTFWGNSSGGVLMLSTKPKRQDSMKVRVKGQLGSFDLQNYQAQIYQPIGDHYLSGYYSYFDTKGFRDYSSAQLHRAGLTGNLKLNDDMNLNLMAAFLSMPFAEHPGSLTKRQADSSSTQALQRNIDTGAGKSLMQGQFGANFNWDSEIGDISATAYHVVRQLENPLSYAFINLDRNAGGGRFTLQNDDLPIHWSIGGEYKYQYDERFETNNDGGNQGDEVRTDQLEDVINKAAFAYLKFPYESFYLNAGVRYDNITFSLEDNYLDDKDQSGERPFDAFNYSVGAGYRFSDQHIFANISTAFQAPTTTELENSPAEPMGFNRDIKPESIQNIEVGIRGVLSDIMLRYDIALYNMKIDDMLISYQLEGEGEKAFYENKDETRHRGIELALSLVPIESMTIGASYTYNMAEFVNATEDSISINENKIPGIPEHLLNPYLSYKYSDFTLQLDYTFVSSYFVNNLNSEENEAYGLLDIRLNHSGIEITRGSKIVPFIALYNVLDKKHNSSVLINAFGNRFFEPGAERYLRAGFSLVFE